MGQVTIYLEEEVEMKMRAAAKAMHISQSKWVARLIREKTTDTWPDSIAKLAGAWPDLPAAEEIRAQNGTDIPREGL